MSMESTNLLLLLLLLPYPHDRLPCQHGFFGRQTCLKVSF